MGLICVQSNNDDKWTGIGRPMRLAINGTNELRNALSQVICNIQRQCIRVIPSCPTKTLNNI